MRLHEWKLRLLRLGLFGALFYVGATFLFLSTPIFESAVVLAVQQGKLEVGRGWS